VETKKRLDLIVCFTMKIKNLLLIYRNCKELKESENSIHKQLNQSNYLESKSIFNFQCNLKDLMEIVEKNQNSFSNLKNIGKMTSELVRKELYFTSNDSFNLLKSEIRSLKGILLSRQNFPLK
jgi:hypothetical protein